MYSSRGHKLISVCALDMKINQVRFEIQAPSDIPGTSKSVEICSVSNTIAQNEMFEEIFADDNDISFSTSDDYVPGTETSDSSSDENKNQRCRTKGKSQKNTGNVLNSDKGGRELN